MGTDNAEQFLTHLPKADPHVHFEGTVDLKTLKFLAERNNISLSSPTTLAPFPPIPPPEAGTLEAPFHGTFSEFIRLYVKISSVIRTVDDFVTVAKNYGTRAQSENIKAIEMYFTPSTFLGLGLELSTIIDGLTAVQETLESYGIQTAWIFDIVRNSLAPGERTVEAAVEFRSKGVRVMSVGLAGLESGYPSAPFAKAIALAREHRFRIYAHAGETAGPESIRETLEFVNPERIGHGVRAIEDEALISELRKKKITLEICPWSNISLGVFSESDHPIAALQAKQLDIVIGSDDPGIFGKSLTENYLFAHQRGVPLPVLEQIASRSLEVCRSEITRLQHPYR